MTPEQLVEFTDRVNATNAILKGIVKEAATLEGVEGNPPSISNTWHVDYYVRKIQERMVSLYAMKMMEEK